MQKLLSLADRINRGGRSGEPAGWVHDATAAVAISATAKRGGEFRSGGGVDLVRGHDAVEVVREQHVGIYFAWSQPTFSPETSHARHSLT